MLLYNAPDPAPNPRRVRLFLAEKGLDIPMRDLAIVEREQKAPDFLAKNPAGQLPALELDDGTVIAESVSICRYLEALHPDPPLFGSSPEEMARIDMWLRRVENMLMVPVGMVWIHSHPFTAGLGRQFTDFGEASKERVAKAKAWFDGQLDGSDYLAGERYSMADIMLLTTVDFALWIGLDMPEDAGNLRDWHDRVSTRESVQRA
ncbi:glutathione S-transferase family protein [Parasphingopyxis algicola]|uniref:glutathione S-transferase family protein n=1 Tax=Parasphingopyxis algicola TaxID=2026624 RepID=UPI0015A164F6|nr:glutathione S-transferase family protein [Parasphingopyxis algicola]QLC25788.1 glutathione S-transferase family protein [Parasphingopyxis algicola]